MSAARVKLGSRILLSSAFDEGFCKIESQACVLAGEDITKTISRHEHRYSLGLRFTAHGKCGGKKKGKKKAFARVLESASYSTQ